MRDLRAFGILADLLRDLRDRRLALPVVVLLAGLVAVPTLLARSTDAPPPPAPAATEGGASPTEAAVLAESGLDIRDYRERLGRLKSKNPFDQQFPLPDVSSSDDLDVTSEDLSLDTGATTTSEPSQEPSAPVATPKPAPAPAPPGGSTSAGGAGGGGDGGGGSASPRPPRIDPRYFTWRVDVSVGPVGAAVSRDGVKQLTMLPSAEKPVVVFLGVTEDGKRAVFAVSGDVSAVTGTGKCVPSAADCAYVVLEEGEQSVFAYDPDGVSYRLTLREIRRVQVKGPGTFEGDL